MSLEIRAISTTVSCSVSSGEGHLSAEVDSRPYGHNGGRSQYYKNDKCYVIVYKTPNVTILQPSFVNVKGTTLTRDSSKKTGYNLKRESIAFSTPIANSSKPLSGMVTLNGAFDGFFCTGLEYLPNYTTLRVKTWDATLELAPPPPYGLAFIEYTPNSEIWVFDNLQPNSELINTEVHGIFYGTTTAGSGSFSSLA